MALQSPVGTVDRMLRRPFRHADLVFGSCSFGKKISLFELSVTISSTQAPEIPGET